MLSTAFDNELSFKASQWAYSLICSVQPLISLVLDQGSVPRDRAVTSIFEGIGTETAFPVKTSVVDNGENWTQKP